jgi:hypothetical protein
MADCIRLPDGRLRIPVGGRDQFGNWVDGETVIGPEHPAYERWLPFAEPESADEVPPETPPEDPDDRP